MVTKLQKSEWFENRNYITQPKASLLLLEDTANY